MPAPPPATPLRVALGFALLLLVGLLLVAAARAAAGGRPFRDRPIEDLALAWAAGMAGAAPLLVLAGLAGLPLRGEPLALALLAIAAAAGGVAAVGWRTRRGGRRIGRAGSVAGPTGGRHGGRPLRKLRIGAVVVVVAALLLAVAKLDLVPLWSWDHFAIWGLKARLFAAAGELDPALLEPSAMVPTVPDYPLGLPLAWLAATLGAMPGDAVFRLAHAGSLAALVALVHAAARRLSGQPFVALAAAGFVAVSPLAWDSIHLGVAEVPLALAATAAVAAALVALAEAPAGRGWWALAGLFAGSLPWLKTEGVSLAALVALALAAWRWTAGRTGRAGDLAAFWAPAAALGGTAVAIGRWLLPTGVSFFDGPWRLRLGHRLAHPGEVLAPMAVELSRWDWLGAWPALALVVVAAAILRRGRVLALAAVAVGQIAIYTGVFFVTYLDPADHVATALSRIAAALVPLAVLAAAALAAPRHRAGARLAGATDMSTTDDAGLFAAVRRFAGDLRYPQLFFLTAALFALDLAIPDLVPFADEILLGLLTLLLARLRDRRDGGGEARVKNVTPPPP